MGREKERRGIGGFIMEIPGPTSSGDPKMDPPDLSIPLL